MDTWIGQQLGPYELQGKLGAGGMGVVYRGVHKRLGQTRAIKVLPTALAHDETFLQRFEREARLASELRHPNIVIVHDIAEENGVHFIAMELLNGRSLHEVIREDGPLPVERSLKLLGQLADALDFAHQRGVVHRDIKPGNAIVDPDDHLTLVDFGIARAAEGTRLTEASMRIGTAEYMAPETITDGESGAGTDLYALGVIAYEMLTGRVPFTGVNSQTIMYAQIHTPPPGPRTLRTDLPPAVEQVILRQLAKSPTERYPTGRSFVLAIWNAANGKAPAAPPTVTTSPETVAGTAATAFLGSQPARGGAPSATPPPRPAPGTAAPTVAASGPASTPVPDSRPFVPPPPTSRDVVSPLPASPVTSGIHRVLEQTRPSMLTLYKLAFGVLAVLLLLLTFVPLPHDPLAGNYQARGMYPLGMAGAYPLGADDAGRDVLSRLMLAGRFEVLRLLVLALLVGGGGFLARVQMQKRSGRAWPSIPVLVMAVALTLAVALLAETAIGLFGTNTTLRSLGIVGRVLVGAPAEQPSPSWSNMLIDGREMGLRAPWLVVFPFLALIGSMVGIVLLASGIVDLLKRREPAATAILPTDMNRQ